MTNNTAAFITYNTLRFASGWHERNGRKALVVQNTKGRGARREGGRQMSVEEVRNEIDLLFAEAERHRDSLDHLVVYVGAGGSERAIELASKFPAEKIIFLGCRCGIAEKERLVQAAGLGGAHRILCECGGHGTMQEMIESFLEGDPKPVFAL